MIGGMLSENSTLASYTPNIAAEIDGEHADLIERFADVVEKHPGLPPTTRLAFNKAVVGIFIKSLKAGLLEEAVEAGRADAYNLAAVAMFQVLEMVTSHENPEMLRVCLKFAIGIEPRSQTAVARQFGVDKATISKWARRFVVVLNLVPGRGMKRPEAVLEYSARQARIWQERFEGQLKAAA